MRSISRSTAILVVILAIGAVAGGWALVWRIGSRAMQSARIPTSLAPSGVTRIDLEIDLRAAPRLQAVATLASSVGSATDRLEFLLNRDLKVERVTERGRELEFRDGPKIESRYKKEARIVVVERGATREPIEVRIEYSGRGLDGTEGQDWMGVLLLAPDEHRMSPQTVFYPQVDADFGGPGVAPLDSRVRVLAPEGFEVYVPGRAIAREAIDGSVAWTFESERPTQLSLFAAPRVRRETVLGDTKFVTLLRSENAALGEDFARIARRALDMYAELWGPLGAQSLGVCEIVGRGSSYNWASQGIVTLESGAIRAGVPVEELAHEIAHLWWGQDVVASGRGERFLTESLAEYAAWRFVELERGADAREEAVDAARSTWSAAIHARGADPALHDVTFATPDYQALVYAKGPLALHALENRIGAAAMDALLRDYRAASSSGGTLEAFVAALKKHGGVPREVLPWLTEPGHVHLALADVVDGEAGTRGTVDVIDCPARCPTLVPQQVEIRAVWPGGSETLELEITGARAPFQTSSSTAAGVLELDPRALLLGERGASLYRGRARLESTEPVDGARDLPLGPLTLKLRFAAPLAPLEEDFVARTQRAVDALFSERWAAITDRQPEDNEGRFVVTAARLEEDEHVLVLDVDRTLPGVEHVLVLRDALRDRDGFALAELRLTFHTRAVADADRPRVVSSEPRADAIDVPITLNSVRVVFSTPMRAHSGFKKPRIAELAQEGWAFPKIADSRWEDDRTFVIEVEDLEPGKRYALPFGARYLAAGGEQIQPFDLKFTVARR